MSGVSPVEIKYASPSAIAVFPTPLSPTNSGLFLFLLDRICINLSISFFLPMTLSIFLFFAWLLRLIKNSFLFVFDFELSSS